MIIWEIQNTSRLIRAFGGETLSNSDTRGPRTAATCRQLRLILRSKLFEDFLACHFVCFVLELVESRLLINKYLALQFELLALE